MNGHNEPGIDRAAIAAAISEQITAIHEESYDTPVKRVVTNVLDEVVLVILDIELSVIEQRMIEYGRGSLVHDMRHAVQTAEEASFTAVVERATGRRVVAFSSHTHLDPSFAAELFRLSPAATDPPHRH